jgi:hypothetical protein
MRQRREMGKVVAPYAGPAAQRLTAILEATLHWRRQPDNGFGREEMLEHPSCWLSSMQSEVAYPYGKEHRTMVCYCLWDAGDG